MRCTLVLAATQRRTPRSAGRSSLHYAERSVAALFPVVMDAHLVAFLMVMMLVSLGGSDGAQGSNSCSDGENNFFHYRILNSTSGTNPLARRVPNGAGRMPHIVRAALERGTDTTVNWKHRVTGGDLRGAGRQHAWQVRHIDRRAARA